eukprot:CAMPEP_0173422036 /NCGR_PEP_ID=MMETSP1357-20121228/2898_1 /TAXON_ID=77926 /ORGANISM="Hemiselmis rufescens, Strain PCC563" /LENGTH=84 /DNA_ID=CAMNT_0014385011 /DNA_START=198 /DNA_END=452 /DNA_ORIENTATION=-
MTANAGYSFPRASSSRELSEANPDSDAEPLRGKVVAWFWSLSPKDLEGMSMEARERPCARFPVRREDVCTMVEVAFWGEEGPPP